MRQYIAPLAEARSALHTFLTLASDELGSVSVEAVRQGEMTLSSPTAVESPADVGLCGPQTTGMH